MIKIIGLVQVKRGAARSTVSTKFAGDLSKSVNTSDCTVTDIVAKLREQEVK